MADTTPGTAPVTDARVPPRGVLPRHAQTWLMAALALGILAIILVTGDREPDSREAIVTPAAPSAPRADRLRDYQDRLRVVDQRAQQQLEAEPRAELPPPPLVSETRPAAPAPPDPLAMERRRREEDSLFASNVVLSRRPEGQRLRAGQDMASRPGAASTDTVLPVPPTLDDVAEAVIRASAGSAQPHSSATRRTTDALAPPAANESVVGPPPPADTRRPMATGPITALGPWHAILEGTVIDTVLTNRLDGSVAAPVNCLVTNPVYTHNGQHVLIPAGARVLGTTTPVQAAGETRLAVSFTRLVMPDGRTYRLDQFMGLNEIGDAGLRDQVNQHYRSTFGASAAVGLLSGFAQYLGTAGFSRGSGDRTVIVAGGVGDATADVTAQAMNRYLNRLPSITIREGHRVVVYVTSDLELPAYDSAPLAPLLNGGRSWP